MKLFLKAFTAAVLPLALCVLVLNGTASSQQDNISPAASIDNPILLVHGLGGGPDESSWGNLKQYLEAFYFDVEYMDFSKIKNKKLRNHKDEDNVSVLAALLGKKVKDMIKQYGVDKINIVAHSFGGLIVQAYLLDRGADFDKKNGVFEFEVDKVLYLQTPFYGTNADKDLLLTLAQDTDYGPYTRPEQMVKDMQFGSDLIFSLDATLRSFNLYEFDVDSATFVSKADEIVSQRSGTLPHFTLEFNPFKRFRILDGFKHTQHELSGQTTAKRVSLAYVNKANSLNFVGITSFLDDANRWRKLPANLDPNGILLVRHDVKKAKEGDITLTLKQKIKVSGAKKSSEPKKGDEIPAALNSDTNIFHFQGLIPGKYTLKVNGKKTLTKEITYLVKDKEITQLSYSYDAKKNELVEGDGTAGKLNGIFTRESVKYTGNHQEVDYQKINGLDVEGFEISCNVEGAKINTFDKGRVFILYNNNGSKEKNWNQNGGRLEVQIRGTNVENDDLQHANSVALLATVDADRDGFLDNNVEDHEEKSAAKFDWVKLHQIKLTVKYIKTNNVTLFTLRIDGKVIFDFDLRGKYYNPNPWVSFGGKRHDVDYFSPNGVEVTRFVIRNLND